MNSFLKDKGYIWSSGLSGHLVYAPKGKQLKNKLEGFLRHYFEKMDFQEIETPLIHSKDVWETFGHWNSFQDPIIYTKTGKCFRLDKVLEENQIDNFSDLSWKEIITIISEINKKEMKMTNLF